MTNNERKRDEALKKINIEFGNYFKILFNGGTANWCRSMKKRIKKKDEVEEDGRGFEAEEENEEESHRYEKALKNCLTV